MYWLEILFIVFCVVLFVMLLILFVFLFLFHLCKFTSCIRFILIDVFQMLLKLYHWFGRSSISNVVILLWCNYLLLNISHFLWTDMSFLHPRMKCAEFGWWFCRRRFIANVYLFCRYYLSLKRAWSFIFTNFKTFKTKRIIQF